MLFVLNSFLLMMVMFELILKKFKIYKSIYLDFDMAFMGFEFLIVNKFEALFKIMQMKKGIGPWGLTFNLS